jgi:outer membrane protein TolC
MLALTVTLVFAADPLRLRQALDAAIARADRDGSGQSVAEAQLGLLRSLDRVKVELRPQVGIFSFSQPSLLATSAGAGVVISHRTAPGQSAIQSAELDVVGTEIAHKRARIKVQIETARQFFDLLAKQENAQRTCASLQDAKRRQVDMAKLLKNAKLTAVDLVRFDEQVLERQLNCIDAETQQKLAAVQLATLIGASDQSGELRVQDVDLPVPGPERPVPSLEQLFGLAMTFRPEPKLIEDQIAAVTPKSETASRLRPDVLSMGYYRVQESPKFTGAATPNYLLGGNTVRAEANWTVPLRNTGERSAAHDVVDAKLRGLESQFNALREEVRNELAAIRILAAASLERLPVARQRMELVDRSRTLVATRFQSGLGNSSVVFEAEQQTVQAQSGLTQATCDLKASTFLMLAVAGIDDKPVAEQDRLLGYAISSLRPAVP